jgi:hypothetical protein
MVLPGDVEQTLLAALTAGLPTINVAAIGEADFGDDGQLVTDLPAAHSRYVGTGYKNQGDNQWLTYDVAHIFEIWCAAENLTNKEAQRTATLAVVDQVLPLIAGARLVLPDTSTTDPVVLKGVGKLPDDVLGMIYICTIEVSAIAQFPGTLAAGTPTAGNEDD